jgi:serine/threonine protein kinase
MAKSNPNAQALIGYTFKTGWKVKREHLRPDNATGGAFSICLDVEKDGKEYFMKALDFDAHLRKNDNDGDEVKAINDMTAQHLYEERLCKICKDGNLKKVVHVIDSGQEIVPSLNILVPYLIFDKADMDVHDFLEKVEQFDFVWHLKTLHQVALGLLELHKVRITHQDIKPSNILFFNNDVKLSDLGRSFCEYVQSPFEEKQYPGDHNYWPPEKRYRRNIEKSWEQRCLTDCYLLGSLMTYYLTRESMNSIMDRHMPQSMHPSTFNGRWEEVVGPLKIAFVEALTEIEETIPYRRKGSKSEEIFRNRLRFTIERLCFPIYEERGFVKYQKRGSQMLYQTERAMSELALLVHQAESLSLSK